MSNKEIFLPALLREAATKELLTEIIPDGPQYVLQICNTSEEFFQKAAQQDSHCILLYELPDLLEIPDPVLQKHAALASNLPIICIGSEDMPPLSYSYDLLLDFLSRSELTTPILISTLRNLLARHDAHLSLERSHTQLSIAKEELSASDFGAGIAHDANNMLSATLGHLQLLSSLLSSEKGEKIEEHLSAAMASCKHVSYLLQEWKKSTDKDHSEEESREPLALKTVINELKSIVSPLIPERITFSIEMSDNGYLLGSRHQLEQVLLNFILNAVQAMPYQGEITLSVQYLYEEQHPVAALKITDTGEGIPEEKLASIFNPFFSSKKKKGGTGLGLAMVNKIVHKHGGRISVESEVGIGTTFTVFLPLLSTESQSTVCHDKKENKSNTESPTVVVIDDTTSLLSIMEDFLEEYGMSAETFSDPTEAIKWSNDHGEEIDLIVLDLQLPILSGKECFYHYKKMLPDVPIIVYSGARDPDVDELLENGAERFFEKPLDYEQTIQWIKERVERKTPSS